MRDSLSAPMVILPHKNLAHRKEDCTIKPKKYFKPGYVLKRKNKVWPNGKKMQKTKKNEHNDIKRKIVHEHLEQIT